MTLAVERTVKQQINLNLNLGTTAAIKNIYVQFCDNVIAKYIVHIE